MFDEKYMRAAITLAKKGIGAVNPNPLVGAVIVKDDQIIGQGYHKAYGGLHAEREAFKNLTQNAEGADMYVTLEPCCHHGKQPPCVEAIVEHKIKRVYVGSDDPNSLVSGKGYEYLREHGIEVHTHILKDECDALNDIFFHYITTKTPYVIMKYAMTMDGKIASYTGKSKWISNEASRYNSQELRNRCSGIMVGIGTVFADDPMLTCRLGGGYNPIRIICDTKLRIPLDSKIVKTAGEVRTIVAAGESIKGKINLDDKSDLESVINNRNDIDNKIDIKDKYNELIKRNVEVIFIEEEDGKINLKKLMNKLGELEIDSVIIEGGGTLNYSSLEAEIVNEVMIYMAPKLLGGKEALTAVEGQGFEEPDLAAHFTLKEVKNLDGDLLIRYVAK
ncbi:MAG: bifunctional diaminohydroxyphosphoribosylaminopyrimidine deaminase/5-amino-6-(5-phosphoribosylamino)uracil reductase RibD [Lachnospiraceae bacterium]|nr:bifunctional diaminohydroxyphosphoribosylaminopyrimidine deaminase/5-amino-6-(5-phosphoribosylamino)uracil reductase RibD [Lachnospiraceae bacterium]